MNKPTDPRELEIWKDLRKKVIEEIDRELQMMMINQARKVGLKIENNAVVENVETIRDIGTAFHCDNSVSTATKVNSVLNDTFKDSGTYEFYIETEIMRRLRLRYVQVKTTFPKRKTLHLLMRV